MLAEKSTPTMQPPQPFRSGVPSQIEGVSDVAWSRFVQVMRAGKISSVSVSGGLGMFHMRPRRLEDLGFATDLKQQRMPSGRLIWTCKLKPEYRHFLANPALQYIAFSKSMKEYFSKIRSGEIKKPDDISDSGALAILHRAGPNSLGREMFPDTKTLFEKAQGIF